MKTDTEILNYILSNAEPDGYGWWLPEWMLSKEYPMEDGWDHKPSIEEMKEHIVHRINNDETIKKLQKEVK